MNVLNPLTAIIHAAETGYMPDSVLRLGIRRLLKFRLKEISNGSDADHDERLRRLVGDASSGPIALVPERANRQHYEVPAEFFQTVLGRRLKYSCCYWPKDVSTLDDAEAAALRVTCAHAEIEDGMRVLELGCGWGSLSLWIAQTYPASVVTAVSNSMAQRRWIEARAAESGVRNLCVITADINNFDPGSAYDRVVSVEMFEHVRNHRELLRRISNWLTAEGKLFVHLFCHRRFPYLFESRGPQDWMAEHFFSGGMMPSESLLLNYNQHVKVSDQWRWSGRHYARTCEAWLDRMDSQVDVIRPVFSDCYGKQCADVWIQRWRLFFMACAELFAFRGGEEWFVSHYLMERHRTRLTAAESAVGASARTSRARFFQPSIQHRVR